MALNTSPAALRRHAYQLAAAFGAVLCERADLAPDEACAVPHLRAALCHPIIDETTYAVALHELGHLVSPTGALRGLVNGNAGNLMRDEESSAWAWARHYALVWTPVMEHVATWAEGTYANAGTPRAAAPRKQEINWNDWRAK